MQPTNEVSVIELFIRTWGALAGLAVYILLKELIPFIKKYLPERMRQADKERLAKLQVEHERENEVAEERKWHRTMEAGLLDAVQAIRENLVQINADNTAIRESEGIILENQRTIMDKQDVHHNATMEAIGEMKQEVARRKGVEQGKAMPKTGPIEEKKDKPS